jgi:Putative zinc-finger
MTARCTDLDIFFDGELDADQAAAFRDHLATCERCQRVLHGRMQEEVAAQADAAAQPADAIPIATARAARAAASAAGTAASGGPTAGTPAASTPAVSASAGAPTALAPAASSSSAPARSRGSRRGVLIYLAPVLAAAAALPLFLLSKRDDGGPLEVAYEIEQGGPTARGSVHVGDVLRSTVRGERHRALWVYFEGHELIAACPNDARCSNDGSDMVLRLTLKQRGQYTVVALGSDDAIPPPAPGGTLDEQLAAQSAGIHSQRRKIEVD